MRHLAVSCLGLGIVCAFVAASSASPVASDFGFVEYDGAFFPEASTPAWSIVSNGGTRQILTGGILEIDTMGTNTQHRYAFARQYNATERLDRTAGYVLEMSLAIPAAETNINYRNRTDACMQIEIMDIDSGNIANGSHYYVGIDRNGVAVSDTVAGAPLHYVPLATYSYNPDNQNLFSIVRQGAALKIFLNDQEVLNVPNLAAPTVTGPSAGSSRLEYGDRATSYDARFNIDFIRAGTLQIPEPATAGLLSVGSMLVLMRRR